MRILFLTQIIPFPPDAGPKVKTWHVLQHLADKGHEITLASFVRGEEEKYVDELRRVCAEVYTVPIHRSRLADLLFWIRSVFSGRPFLIERDDIPAMRSLVGDLLQTGFFDVVHADQLTMTQFIIPKKVGPTGKNQLQKDDAPEMIGNLRNKPGPRDRTKRIFDAHNAVWTILQRIQEMSRFYLLPFLSREVKRIKTYEGMIVHTFDQTLAVSEIDYQALSAAEHEYCKVAGTNMREPDRISVIPIAVDISEYQRIAPLNSNTNILAMGTLHYPPNADGIRWFMHDIFPLVKDKIPEVTLTIVGKNPPSDLVTTAATMPNAITVTGYVPDLQPYLEAADVMVVPVRSGGGMRVRILEGLAWGIPMVTTTIGLEGIKAVPGRDILVADDDMGFAQAVCSLLASEALRSRMSENGLQLAKHRYDWQVVLSELDRVYA